MPRSHRLLALLLARSLHRTTSRLTIWPAALCALVTVPAFAQGRAEPGTPLHVAVSRFEFVASADAPSPGKPLRIHNGGTARFTDVRLTRLTYVDSARGASWLVLQPHQSSVAPDELATIGTLCVDASGLPAGTYRATAAVAAHEVPEPVAITITLVVKGSVPPARGAAARCGTAVTK